MDDGYVLVMTTVADEERASKLARSIVEARLAACVQVQPVRSVYRWQSEVCEQPECLLLIKTAARRFMELERHIKANHAYETPEIVRVAITGGSREYLAWVDDSTL